MSEETQIIVVGCVAVAIGIYCICAAIFNWNWFFNNFRAGLFVTLFGRNGARIAYALLGLIFAGIGIYVLIGNLML